MCHNGLVIDPASIDIVDLLVRWYGPPTASVQPLSVEAAWLPVPLKEWYRLVPDTFKVQSGGHQMYEPSLVRIDRGKAVFMEDPTGDWLWAFDPDEPNRVYERAVDDDWNEVPLDLVDFLKYVTIGNIITLCDFGRACTHVPAETLPAIIEPMEEAGFGEGSKWPRPGQRLFMNDSLLAKVGPAVNPLAPWQNRPGYVAVRVAAVEPSNLGYLDLIPLEWIDLGLDE